MQKPKSPSAAATALGGNDQCGEKALLAERQKKGKPPEITAAKARRIAAIHQDERLSDREKRVAVALIRMASPAIYVATGGMLVGVSTFREIARAVRLTRKIVGRAVRRLRWLGFVMIQFQGERSSRLRFLLTATGGSR